jgi:flagellar operon protein
MNVSKNFTSIEQMRENIQSSSSMQNSAKSGKTDTSFDEILFSKHASRRLETRNIDMSQEQKERLQDAASQAREKGMKESLVMVDNLAFIVNVKNNTVITAVNDTSHAVFTNIDGAIIN